MKAPVRVAVTGAAGQISYSLIFRIASGNAMADVPMAHGKSKGRTARVTPLPSKRRADGDQHVCHKSRRSVPDPAFRSEDPADAQREQDPEDDVCRTQSAGPRDFPEQELTGRHPEICSAGDGCLSGIRLIRQK